MKKILVLFLLIAFIPSVSQAQKNLEAIELSKSWSKKIKKLSPKKTTVKTKEKRKVLLFSLYTGFNHWVIPFSDQAITIMAQKTKAFDVVQSNDISVFEDLSEYDAIVLNNNCSKRDERDLFYDVFIKDTNNTPAKAKELANALEMNLLSYVSNGGGLMVLHGGIVMQNDSPMFGNMVGGNFDYHPVQQPINVKLVDKNHPLVASFNGKGFTHVDEPYFFNNAYFDYNFRPLLYMDTNELISLQKEVKDPIKYISWIKSYGQGRVFYSSPSHNAQSYDNPDLLKFLLDGLQYCTGDLKCDDSPIDRN